MTMKHTIIAAFLLVLLLAIPASAQTVWVDMGLPCPDGYAKTGQQSSVKQDAAEQTCKSNRAAARRKAAAQEAKATAACGAVYLGTGNEDALRGCLYAVALKLGWDLGAAEIAFNACMKAVPPIEADFLTSAEMARQRRSA